MKMLLKVGGHSLFSVEGIRALSSSKFNYWAGYVANITLVLWLLSHAFFGPYSILNGQQWLKFSLLGLGLWSFFEYVLHRYLYHEIPGPLTIGHDLHHQEPRALLGIPWYLTAVVLVGIYYLLTTLLPKAQLGIVMGFCWLGYIGYCLMHHAIHHWNFKNQWFRGLRSHHLKHHHFHNSNWGITTVFWDRIFRTKS